MGTKICKMCLVEKELDNFYLRNDKPGTRCKKCCIERQKDNISKNKESVKEYKKEHYLKNKDKIKEISKVYYENNKEVHNEYMSKYQKDNSVKLNKYRSERDKERRSNDPLFRLKVNIRANISSAIKRSGYKRTSRTYDILDCSYEDFLLYIESRFESWMTWENYGKYNGELNYGWDIDHIVPVSSATTEDEMLLLNKYTNLQPLCSRVNRDIKKDKINF